MVSLSTISVAVAQAEPAHAIHADVHWDAAPSSPFASLSPREQQIAAAAAAGQSNKEIARLLDISPWTVSSHLRQIFAKLGISRRLELSLLWHRAG